MNLPTSHKKKNTISCSIIIRTKDRPNQLTRSLISLRKQLRQPEEIVVINDGGHPLDEVINRFEDLPLVYLENEKNQGRSAAGNRAVKKATGTTICFLDDDDIFYPDHLQRLILCMEKFDARVAYSGCALHRKDLLGDDQSPEQNVSAGVFNDSFDSNRLQFENYIPLITLIIEMQGR